MISWYGDGAYQGQSQYLPLHGCEDILFTRATEFRQHNSTFHCDPDAVLWCPAED
jgi:hypothetical protein